MDDARRTWVDSGGVRLAGYEWGDPATPTVLLVHGYPDNATIWHGVARLLRERFHVVSYDVRGHGASAEPGEAAGYRMAHLVDDLVAVADAVSSDRPVHLLAHDWGSVQAWHTVTEPRVAGRFASLTSISGPNLDHVGRWVRGAPRHPARLPKVARQLAHSWYIGAFQLPVLPELVWRLRPLRARLRADYRDARNGLELYRANMLRNVSRPSALRTAVPVQQIALTRDPYVTPDLLAAADPWCERLWRRELASGHWAPRSHPDAVARLFTEFVDHLDGAPATRELARARVRPSTAEESIVDGKPGRLVLITGAGSGIGRASALAFASTGAEVLCADIDLDAARRTVKDLPGPGAAYQLDVADGAACQRLADTVLAEHGVPDVVMANAGVGVAGSFLDTSEEDWRRVLDVNLWGVVHTLRAFLPPLVDRREGGHVVITSSAAGYLPMPSLPAYSATKAGVLMLAQCLAPELSRAGIGVSAICPGVVHTNITNTTRFAGSDAEQERVRRARATELYQRRGFEPERVAAEVVNAVRNNRLVVPVTPEARLTALGTRVAPSLTRAFARWLDAAGQRRTRSAG